MMKRYYYIFFLLAICQCVFGQRIDTEFGKNRVQYHDDFSKWSRYETENFVVYWYGKSRNVAHSVIQIAENDHAEIQTLLEHRMNDKIEILVYTDLSDIKQSNVGTEAIFQNSKGETKTVGKKMFVYFDGDHQNLRSQVRQGISSVYINSIIYGSNIQEIVQNALLLNLPPWFTKGIERFADESWNETIHHELRNKLNLKEKYFNFEKLAADYPSLAGHSMWHFLEKKYGRTRISQIIYITRIYRNLENSFSFVLYVPYDEIMNEWADFYYNFYDFDNEISKPEGKVAVKIKQKNEISFSALDLSPNEKSLAYITNEYGKQKLFIQDVKSGKSKCVFKNDCKNPFQTADENYPLITWHPGSEIIYIIYEKDDIPYFRRLHLPSGEIEEKSIPESFQRIYSLDFINENQFLFSASVDGFSDLFIYKPSARNSTRLTNDFWDDLDANYIKNSEREGILFRSNRLETTLKREKLDSIIPIQKFDIFFMDLKGEEKTLSRLTNSPEANESNLHLTSDNKLVYLQTKEEFQYRQVKPFFGFESPNINSDPDYLILSQELNHDGSNYYYTYKDEKYIYINKVRNLDYSRSFMLNIEEISEPVIITEEKEEKKKVETKQRLFQSEFEDPETIEPIENLANNVNLGSEFSVNEKGEIVKKVHRFEPFRASAARLKFGIFDFSTTLDNQPLFDGLESYTALDDQLSNDPVGILVKAKIKDKFEDYAIEGGARFPTTLNGSEYFLTFDNIKKKWDKRFVLYKKTESNAYDLNNPFDRIKKRINLGMVQYKYPFDIFRSVRLSSYLRFDQTFYSSTDLAKHESPFFHEKRINLKAEYIYDNTFDAGINIKNGTRYKFYVEAINEFNFELRRPINVDLSTGFTSIFGFDARHYIPIFKKSVLAIRGAGATSMGSKKMLYFLGGTENWILPEFDNSIPIPDNQSFAYKALAPNLRGFGHNIRNGGTFLVGNIEYRIPIVRMLFGDNIKRAFFRNFQVIGFFDAGVAWHGFSPYSEDNPLNTVKIVKESTDGPDILVLNVTYFRDPLVMGYGYGFRTSLLGYFVRLDIARGIETSIIQERKIHLSLGYDF